MAAEIAAVTGHFDTEAARAAHNQVASSQRLVQDWYNSLFDYDRDGVLLTLGRHYAFAAYKATELAGFAVKAAADSSTALAALEALQQLGDMLPSVMTDDERLALPAGRIEFEQVRRTAAEQRWTDTTAFPEGFFALHSRFDTMATVDSQSIIQVCSQTQLRTLQLVGDPSKVFRLTPREFEEVIAEIFSEFGFDVALTARTRDGGHDIVAVNHRLAACKYLIECKRYAPTRSVGVNAVRQLHGVVQADGATKGILVTTSQFTAPAQKFMAQQPWLLEGRDFEGLREWLNEYQRWLIRGALSLR